MNHLNDKIETMYKDKNISLAYGHVILDDQKDIKTSIEKADQKMYEYKHSIKK